MLKVIIDVNYILEIVYFYGILYCLFFVDKYGKLNGLKFYFCNYVVVFCK